MILGILLLLGSSSLTHAAGGEIGNAFVRFDSRIGHFTVEYADNWRVNDLSDATSFNETSPTSSEASFFAVEVESGVAEDLPGLGARIKELRPDVTWTPTTVGGVPGFRGADKTAQMIYLFRGPNDQLLLRMRATDGTKSEQVLSHMLETFRTD